MIEFACNVPGERLLFPSRMSKKCVWEACSVCKACMNHCKPKEHKKILNLLSMQASRWEGAIRRAGGRTVRLPKNTDIKLFGVTYRKVVSRD